MTAQHDAALAEFNLAAATGRLIAPELKLPVQLYDMGRHYKTVKDKWLGFGVRAEGNQRSRRLQ